MFLSKNTAGQTVAFGLVSASTGAALTGATVSVRRCLDGTFGAAGGTVTEDANGLYKFAPTQADTNADQVAYFFTASGAVPVCYNLRTTAANMADAMRFGLTALPNVNAGANGGLPTGDASGRVTVGTNADKTGYSLTQAFPTNFASLAVNASGHVVLQDASLVTAKLGTFALAKTTNITGFNDLDAAGTRAAVGLATANLDTQIGTLATGSLLSTVAGYLDTEIAAILADTDAIETRLTATRAGYLDNLSAGAVATASALATVDTVADAIKAKTDSLTFTVAGQVDANVESMNTAELLGSGTSGDKWRGA